MPKFEKESYARFDHDRFAFLPSQVVGWSTYWENRHCVVEIALRGGATLKFHDKERSNYESDQLVKYLKRLRP